MPTSELERTVARPRAVCSTPPPQCELPPIRHIRPVTTPPRPRRGLPQRCYQSVAPVFFAGLWLFIGGVSSLDAALTVKYQSSLVHMELNPVARELLALSGWDPSVMIGVKFAGTILVLGFLDFKHRSDQRFAHFLTAVVAAFQLGLLCFLLGP